MTIRSLSLLLCGLLAACVAPPRKPAEPIEDSARWGTPITAIQAGAGGAAQCAAFGDSDGAMQSAESVSSSGAGGLVGSSRLPASWHGSWHPTDPTPWRSAIENYVPRVRPGNQTALNTARIAFAGYLNAIHNRIHPLFADTFLSSLDSLPATHPMNDQRLSTEVEMVLNQESGGIVRIGVTKSSGITIFDAAVLEAITLAAPYGAPPRDIVSPDCNVYVHWEFHRNTEACSTFNARPFLLKAQPKADPN